MLKGKSVFFISLIANHLLTLYIFPSLPDDTLRQNFSQFGQIYDIKIFPEKFYGFIK